MATRHIKFNKIALAIIFSDIGINSALAEQDKMVVYGNLLGNSRADAVKTYPGNRTVISDEQLSKGAWSLS